MGYPTTPLERIQFDGRAYGIIQDMQIELQKLDLQVIDMGIVNRPEKSMVHGINIIPIRVQTKYVRDE